MTQAKSTGRNPVWTKDETVLALELYLKHRPRLLDDTHPEVVKLSEELKALARASGVDGSETFRNPVGVSMKLGNLRAGDSNYSGSGLTHGSKMEGKVWAEYGSDPLALSIQVVSIRQKLRPQVSVQEAVEEASYSSVSRGPVPFIGSSEHQRVDGDNALYAFRLDGPVERVFSMSIQEDTRVVKVGRSNDVGRRLSELNAGFPAELTIRWTELFRRVYPTAMLAHEVEQRLLTRLHEQGFGLSKEFALIREAELFALIGEVIS